MGTTPQHGKSTPHGPRFRRSTNSVGSPCGLASRIRRGERSKIRSRQLSRNPCAGPPQPPPGTQVPAYQRSGIREPARLRPGPLQGHHDTFGHTAGDTVLAATAARLTAWAGPHAALGRLGGDESRSSCRRPAAGARTASHSS
ncbi:diguanylate cyclase domain-containing protein [Streptomyces sp. NPDC048156]|uniref:diguanylate cyclase domain-containing protein n=1 Tax=Streptomyces sp. NPDC048156 TaxID=3365502 RepID=UPI00371BC6B8